MSVRAYLAISLRLLSFLYYSDLSGPRDRKKDKDRVSKTETSTFKIILLSSNFISVIIVDYNL